MTLALGVLSESGAVLVTDSMVQELLPNGTALGHLAGPEWKLHGVPGVAYVHSGHGLEHPDLPPCPDFQTQAENVHRTLTTLYPPLAWKPSRTRNSDGSEVLDDRTLAESGKPFGQEIIVAALPQPLDAEGPRLGLLSYRPGRSRWLSGPGILAAGSATYWAEDAGIESLPVLTVAERRAARNSIEVRLIEPSSPTAQAATRRRCIPLRPPILRRSPDAR